MKTRKHRIFIIGKKIINRVNEYNTQSNKDDEQQIVATVNQQRPQSKRKKMFLRIPEGKERSQKRSQGKYVYQIKQHIKTQSIGQFLKCDLFQSEKKIISTKQGETVNSNKNSGQNVRQDGNKKISQNFNQNQVKLQAKPPGQITTQKLSTPRHRKIFEDYHFRQNRVMSTHSGTPRKNIFFTYEPPQNSLNKTFSRQRKRIFSLDDAPLCQINEKKSSIIQQIRSFIKEQEELQDSKINEKTTINKQQDLLPSLIS